LSSYRAAANFALGSYFQPATGSTWADYPLFGYRLTTANASNIASVRVTLHSPDDDAIRSFTSRFEGNGSSIIDECHAVIFNSSTVVGRVELVIAVRNASLLAEDPVMVELDGIYFEHENRQTSLRINHTSGGTDMTMSFALPITPFGGLSWASANLTRGAIAGTMTGITITTGTGFNANRTLDIMHLALQQRNLTTNVVNQTYYTMEFNYQDRLVRLASSRLGYTTAPEGTWTAAGTVNATAYDCWLLVTNTDVDFNGAADQSLLQMDVAGDSNFTDGIDDLWQFDADGSGGYELRMFLTTTSRVDTSKDGLYGVNTTTIVNQTAVDADENGVPESVFTTYSTLSSDLQNETARVSWNGTAWVRKPFTYAGSRWIASRRTEINEDQDTLVEYEMMESDFWTDETLDGTPTLESRTVITRTWLYNWSAAEWQVRVREHEENDLLRTGLKFTLLAKDDQQFRNMTCIVLDPVPVVLDPRWDVCEGVRSDRDGAAWFWDSNGDGTYETIFVFTSKTKAKATPEAIGVAFDYNGNNRLDWEWWNFLPSSAADKFFPTYWTNANYDFGYITGLAYEDAWTNYLDQLGTTRFWVKFGVDVGVMIFLIVASQLIATEVCPGYGNLAAALIALAITMAIFVTYAVEEYFFHGTDRLVDWICDQAPERNANYKGDRYKNSGKWPIWSFTISYDLLRSQYPWQGTWAGVDTNVADADDGLIEYQIFVPDYPEGMSQFLSADTLNGFDHMTGHDRRVQFHWFYREFLMQRADEALRADTGGNFTCFMPTIDAEGRIGFFAAPEGSVIAYFNGTDPPNMVYHDGKESPWLLYDETRCIQKSNGFKIDMAITELAAEYQAAYSKASSGDILEGGDWRIFLLNTAIQAAQVAIVSAVCYGLNTLFPDKLNPSVAKEIKSGMRTVAQARAFYGTFTGAELLKHLGQEIFEELVLEGTTSYILEKLGFDPALAEQIGELVWGIQESFDSRAKGPEGWGIMSEAIVSVMEGERLSQQARENLAKLDMDEFIQLVQVAMLHTSARAQQIAIDLARSRLRADSLSMVELANVEDVMALQPASFSQPTMVLKNAQALKSLVISAVVTHPNTPLEELAKSQEWRESFSLTQPGDEQRGIAISIALPGGASIPWAAIKWLTPHELLVLAKYGGSIQINDPNVVIQQTSKSKFLTLADLAKVDPTVASIAHKQVKESELGTFYAVVPGLFKVRWDGTRSKTQGSVPYEEITKGGHTWYRVKATGYETPYFDQAEKDNALIPGSEDLKPLTEYIDHDLVIRIPEILLAELQRTGITDASMPTIKKLLDAADNAQIAQRVFRLGILGLVTNQRIDDSALAALRRGEYPSSWDRSSKTLKTYQNYVRTLFTGWLGQAETDAMMHRFVKALKEPAARAAIRASPSSPQFGNTELQQTWNSLPPVARNYIASHSDRLEDLTYEPQYFLSRTYVGYELSSDGAIYVRNMDNTYDLFVLVEAKAYLKSNEIAFIASCTRMTLNALFGEAAPRGSSGSRIEPYGGVILSVPRGLDVTRLEDRRDYGYYINQKGELKDRRMSIAGQRAIVDARVNPATGTLIIRYVTTLGEKTFFESGTAIDKKDRIYGHQRLVGKLHDGAGRPLTDGSGKPLAYIDVEGNPVDTSTADWQSTVAGGYIEVPLRVAHMDASYATIVGQAVNTIDSINAAFNIPTDVNFISDVLKRFGTDHVQADVFKKELARMSFDKASERTQAYIARVSARFPGLREWVEGRNEHLIMRDHKYVRMREISGRFAFQEPAWQVEEAIGILLGLPNIDVEPWNSRDPSTFVRYTNGDGTVVEYGVASSPAWATRRSTTDDPYADVKVTITADGKSVALVARFFPPAKLGDPVTMKLGVMTGTETVSPAGGTWAGTTTYSSFLHAFQHASQLADLIINNQIALTKYAITTLPGQEAQLDYGFFFQGSRYEGNVKLDTGVVSSSVDGGPVTNFMTVQMWQEIVLPGLYFGDQIKQMIIKKLGLHGIEAPAIMSAPIPPGFSHAYDINFPVTMRRHQEADKVVGIRIVYDSSSGNALVYTRRGLGASAIATQIGNAIPMDILLERLGSIWKFTESIHVGSIGFYIERTSNVEFSADGKSIRFELLFRTGGRDTTSVLATSVNIDLEMLLTASDAIHTTSCVSLSNGLQPNHLESIFHKVIDFQGYQFFGPGKRMNGRLSVGGVSLESIDGVKHIRMIITAYAGANPLAVVSLRINLQTGFIYDISNSRPMANVPFFVQTLVMGVSDIYTGRYGGSNAWISDLQTSQVDANRVDFSCNLLGTPVSGKVYVDGRIEIDAGTIEVPTLARAMLESIVPTGEPIITEFGSLLILAEIVRRDAVIIGLSEGVISGKKIFTYTIVGIPPSLTRSHVISVDSSTGLVSYIDRNGDGALNDFGVLFL
jgi:hypothetical protein